MLLGLLVFATFFELPTALVFAIMSIFSDNTVFKLFWSSYAVLAYFCLWCLAPNPLIALGGAMIPMVVYPIAWMVGCTFWSEHGIGVMFVRTMKSL